MPNHPNRSRRLWAGTIEEAYAHLRMRAEELNILGQPLDPSWYSRPYCCAFHRTGGEVSQPHHHFVADWFLREFHLRRARH